MINYGKKVVQIKEGVNIIIQDLKSNPPSLYIRYRHGRELVEETKTSFPFYWTYENTGREMSETPTGETVYKKYYGDSNLRHFLKKKVHNTFEMDVSLENRYLIDNYDSLPDYEPRIMHLDIETDLSLDALKAEKAITAITIWDSYTNKYITFSWKDNIPKGKSDNLDYWTIIITNSEISMIESFLDIFLDINPDILTGWNIIGYDIKYIINRMYRLGLDPRQLSPVNQLEDVIDYNTKNPIKGRICMDLLFGYKKLTDGDIGEQSLKAVLEDNNAPIQKLDAMGDYHTDFEAFLEYNKRDVEGTVYIDQQFGIIDTFLERQKLVGCKFTDTYYNKDMVDLYHLRGAHNRGYVLPTGEYHEKVSYEGATILEPKAGFYKNVIVLDVKGMYPASMEASNMSFETKKKDGDIRLGNGINFISNPIGLSASLLKDIQEQREYYKSERNKFPEKSPDWIRWDNKQRVTKFLKNSFYGWAAYIGARIYDPDIAASITWLSRKALAHIFSIVENSYTDYKILYAHTDSCFIHIPGDVTEDKLYEIAKEIEDKINNSWSEFEERYNLLPGKYEIEIDKVMETFLLVANNRYAGKYKMGEGVGYKIQGFEVKKKSTSKVIKELQEFVIKSILNEASPEEVQEHVKVIANNIRGAIYSPDEICIKKKLKRTLDKYKVNSDHVSASRWANEFLGCNLKNEGDIVKMIVVRNNVAAKNLNVKSDMVVGYEREEQIAGLDIDLEEMINKLIPGKVERIFDTMGWQLGPLLQKNETKGSELW